MSRSHVLRTLFEARASAILRADDPAVAARAMDAAIDGGFRVVEVTLTTGGAFDLLRRLAARDDLTVGAGTVLDVDQARAAVEAGARFLVSPVTDPAVIAAGRALGAVTMPGTSTPTEAWTAHRAGADLVKLFPAPAGGPTWVRSTLGPMPFLRIVPTNGVDVENVGEWIAAGSFAVGLTTALFDPAELRAGRTDAIVERARALLAAARACERPERAWSFE